MLHYQKENSIYSSTIGKSEYINLKILIQLQVLKKVNVRRVDMVFKFVVAEGCFICYLSNQINCLNMEYKLY